MAQALSGSGEETEDATYEDMINDAMGSRKLLSNASYFAFTATPKNKTLEIFGDPDPQPDGTVRHRAFHGYTMKQAIQEGFILDVLAHYTPVSSYYRIAKTVADDPEFDARKAHRKLRRFVEGHDHAIRLKAEIMVDHFHDLVLAQGKVGGEARAMVVTNGVDRAIRYYHAIRDYLRERKSRHEAIVAFSGDHEYGGSKVNEASLNGFPSSKIAERIQEDPYRFLVCADKFQTGYDEPLLHTMYVDKTLSGIKAVQTLSRLNRAHPKKHDVFVLDFLNDADEIRDSFADFHRTTILSDETDPNKLHDLQAELDAAQVYDQEQIDDFVSRYLAGEDRDKLDPILDRCVAVFERDLDEDGQVAFKGNAKAFVRTYAFLSSILPYTERRMGEAVDLPELPRLQAPRAQGTGPVQGNPGRHRHGQLPRREACDADDHASGRGRGDRARTHVGRGAPAGNPTRTSVEHPQRVQRPLRRHPMGRRRPGAGTDHRDDPVAGGGGQRLQERAAELRQGERQDRAREGVGTGDDLGAERRHDALSQLRAASGVQALAHRPQLRTVVGTG